MSGYGGYEYDTANADTGGGGFMSQDNPSSQGGEKEKKPRDKQSLVPLTVKQLLGATKAGADDEGFSVDGRELSQVRIVGNAPSRAGIKPLRVPFETRRAVFAGRIAAPPRGATWIFRGRPNVRSGRR